MTETQKQIFQEYYERYFEMVYRVCFSFMKNISDTEDAVSETFLKLIQHVDDFDSERHLKGWLVVTASNYCKNQLRHWWRKKRKYDAGWEQRAEAECISQVSETMEAVMALPEKYKAAIYLYYYEGYTSAEIGKMMGKSASTVRSDLQKARRLLKVEIQQNGGI